MFTLETFPYPRLVILSCGQSKLSKSDLMPAVKRYNGMPYKILKRFSKVHPSKYQSLDIYILSAKFGLIPSNKLIPYYDLILKPERVKSLQLETKFNLRRIFRKKKYAELVVVMTIRYLYILENCKNVIPNYVPIKVFKSVRGKEMQNFKNHLYNNVANPIYH